jgi:hypothetical protein
MSAPLPGELDVLRDVSARFERAAIPFMLTGSLAMNYYAEPRMTRDIDIVAELESTDVGRVVRLFETDYYVSQDAVAEAVRDRSSFNVIEQTSVTKVDVFPRKRDHFRETEFARRRHVAIGDFSTWIVTAEDLVLAKLLWARASRSEAQLGDVRTLLRGDVDRTYIETWIRTLALEDWWAEVQR